VLTIVQRLYRRENIFQAHRLHLFQVLVYRAGWSHLAVSGLFAGIQLAINLLIIRGLDWSATDQVWLAAGLISGLGGLYVLVKWRLVNTPAK
jgi:UDP-GlcNAc:undecaprenyl-phosphate/decaprenyl-phosphate GlcNAc-1-phosphate transferase